MTMDAPASGTGASGSSAGVRLDWHRTMVTRNVAKRGPTALNHTNGGAHSFCSGRDIFVAAPGLGPLQARSRR